MVIADRFKSGEGEKAQGIRPSIAYDATDELLIAEEKESSLWSDIPNREMKTDKKQAIEETKEYKDYKTRLNLLYEVGKKVGSVSQLSRLVGRITQMTQYTLKASASSVLLLDEQERELLFEVAEGEARKRLRRIRLSADSGIAGWVARNGRPLIVNDVNKDERFHKGIDETTGYVTKSIICAPLIARRKPIGVIEVLNKLDGSDFTGNDLETLVSVAATAAMVIDNARLNQTVLNSYKSTIKALASAIYAKDPYTRGHSQRVTEYALLAANSLSLSRDQLEVLEYAGILHDIGKIGIADSILTKPKALTVEEQKIMRRHSVIGANMLKDIPFLEEARILVRHHHERYDGKGYPAGLQGEAIPLGARLISVADAFDTMTTDRIYRAALSINYAIRELNRFSGTQFCPAAVKTFISSFNNCHFPHKS